MSVDYERESVNYERELTRIVQQKVPPEYELRSATIPLAAEFLSEIDAEHGPDSADPLSYHNAEHGLDVTPRVIDLINLMYPYMEPHHRRGIYDLGILDSTGHDKAQKRGVRPGVNERASGLYVVGRLSETDDPLLSSRAFGRRAMAGIMATAFRITDGRIDQYNVRRGAREPLKPIMAHGDINGIAMEGPRRIFIDGLNLCFEEYEDPTLDEIHEFLRREASFLQQSLSDEKVKPDIAYHFPDHADEIYEEGKRLFQGNILAAYSLALLLRDGPEIKDTIGRALQGLGMADRTILRNSISRTLHHMLITKTQRREDS